MSRGEERRGVEEGSCGFAEVHMRTCANTARTHGPWYRLLLLTYLPTLAAENPPPVFPGHTSSTLSHSWCFAQNRTRARCPRPRPRRCSWTGSRTDLSRTLSPFSFARSVVASRADRVGAYVERAVRVGPVPVLLRLSGGAAVDMLSDVAVRFVGCTLFGTFVYGALR